MYLIFEKMDQFIYLIVQNVDLFFDFLYPVIAGADRYRSQFIEYQ